MHISVELMHGRRGAVKSASLICRYMIDIHIKNFPSLFYLQRDEFVLLEAIDMYRRLSHEASRQEYCRVFALFLPSRSLLFT